MRSGLGRVPRTQRSRMHNYFGHSRRDGNTPTHPRLPNPYRRPVSPARLQRVRCVLSRRETRHMQRVHATCSCSCSAHGTIALDASFYTGATPLHIAQHLRAIPPRAHDGLLPFREDVTACDNRRCRARLVPKYALFNCPLPRSHRRLRVVRPRPHIRASPLRAASCPQLALCRLETRFYMRASHRSRKWWTCVTPL